VDMHEAYALQWYSLAALAVILALALSFRRVEPA
jgi:cytochrome oxidase assembly protein ShyY1